MQTFLPYADFAASAAVLDERRLGKQRVEALQVDRRGARVGRTEPRRGSGATTVASSVEARRQPIFSKMAAIPWPPPMHSVSSA